MLIQNSESKHKMASAHGFDRTQSSGDHAMLVFSFFGKGVQPRLVTPFVAPSVVMPTGHDRATQDNPPASFDELAPWLLLALATAF
jgi:hypothetical protein